MEFKNDLMRAHRYISWHGNRHLMVSMHHTNSFEFTHSLLPVTHGNYTRSATVNSRSILRPAPPIAEGEFPPLLNHRNLLHIADRLFARQIAEHFEEQASVASSDAFDLQLVVEGVRGQQVVHYLEDDRISLHLAQ